MFEKLHKIEEHYEKIEKLLGEPQAVNDHNRYQELAKEYSDLGRTVSVYREHKSVSNDLLEAKEILKDSQDGELVELARVEAEELKEKEKRLGEELKILLISKDPADEKNAIVEIRAGTGGEEAALFAADLYRMYSRYTENRGWQIEHISSHPTGIGGFKEIIFSVSGKNAYGDLKYESGVHRVQRVPQTESSGRIHTSAASVAILPEAEEVDVEIDPEDLKIDFFRSSGPGGQSVNTTDSAVRITHLPTNVTVQCQDEKSQHKNRAKALKVLRSRLLDAATREQQEKLSSDRRRQIGTGDRSAKIRTYNFPQNRVTDHRINLTLHKLEGILEGAIDELVDAVRIADHAEKIAQLDDGGE